MQGWQPVAEDENMEESFPKGSALLHLPNCSVVLCIKLRNSSFENHNRHLPFEERVKLSHSRLINADLFLLVVSVLPTHVLRPVQ